MSADVNTSHSRGLTLLLTLIKGWALLGGLLLLAIVLMTTYSSLAGYLVAKPFPGDFELTEMGIAVAAFMFLPYCQLTFADVSADIFTAKASPATVRFLGRMGSLVALLFSLLLLWRMFYGLLDYKDYHSTTTILQIPLWYAFVPILASLALLSVAAVITLLYPQDTPNSPLQGL